jgi:hypothetical protein
MIKHNPRTGNEGEGKEYRCNSTLSLTLVLDVVGGKRHASAALPLRRRPDSHCAGGWRGLAVGLNRCRKSRPHLFRNSGRPASGKVVSPTRRPPLHRRSSWYSFLLEAIYTAAESWNQGFLVIKCNTPCVFNSLKAKRKGFYLQIQSVPRSKHTPSRLQKPVS